MSSPIRIVLLVLLLPALAGCAGYGTGSDDALILPPDARNLRIKSVDNPTMRAGLESRLRSVLRDEMTKRGFITWAAPGQDTAYIDVRVERFTSTTSITDKYDTSVLQSANITLSASIHRAGTGDTLWESNNVSASQNFLTGDRAAAEEKVIDLAVRQLVDRLHQNF